MPSLGKTLSKMFLPRAWPLPLLLTDWNGAKNVSMTKSAFDGGAWRVKQPEI
jgi:hypothetical protein